MSDFEYFTRLFDMMHINKIISIFFTFTKKDIHFLKAFYNSLTAKNRFVIKCMIVQFLKKKNHPCKLLCDCSKMKTDFLQTDFSEMAFYKN